MVEQLYTHTHTQAGSHRSDIVFYRIKSELPLTGLITFPAAVRVISKQRNASFLCEISVSAVLGDREPDRGDLMQATQQNKNKENNIMGIIAGRFCMRTSSNHCNYYQNHCFLISALGRILSSTVPAVCVCEWVMEVFLSSTSCWTFNP